MTRRISIIYLIVFVINIFLPLTITQASTNNSGNISNENVNPVTKNVYTSENLFELYNKDQNGKKIIHNKKVIKEMVDKRTQFSKTYLNEDNTITVMSSTYSQNFKNGQGWEEIDTKIVPAKIGEYTDEVEKNNYKVQFNKKIPKILFEFGNASVQYTPLHTSTKFKGNVNGNQLTYSNIWGSTDMSYTVFNDYLKMDLELLSPDAPKTFDFLLNVKNVEPKLNTDGSINFVDKSGKIAFTIPQMWVKDSLDNQSYDKIKTSLHTEKNGYLMSISLDDSNLTYPLVIDPSTVIINGFSGELNEIFLSLPVLDVSKISFIDFKNYSRYDPNSDVPARVYVTKEAYGTGGYQSFMPPESEGKNVVYVGDTDEYGDYRDDGINSNYTRIFGDQISGLMTETKIYGAAFWFDQKKWHPQNIEAFVYVGYQIDTIPDSSVEIKNLTITDDQGYLHDVGFNSNLTDYVAAVEDNNVYIVIDFELNPNARLTNLSFSTEYSYSTGSQITGKYSIYIFPQYNKPIAGVSFNIENGNSISKKYSFASKRGGLSSLNSLKEMDIYSCDYKYFATIGTTSNVPKSYETLVDNSVSCIYFDVFPQTKTIKDMYVNGVKKDWVSLYTEDFLLIPGHNAFAFSITAENGSIRRYSFDIIRGGKKLKYDYDSRGRINTISIEGTGKVIQTYTYDNNGNLLNVTVNP